MDENKTPAVCENTERLNRSDRRSLMLIISAALQWVLILVCIVYLAVLYKESHQEVIQTKVYVITEISHWSSTSQNCTKIKLEMKSGSMIVQNGSIFIPSSGFYLAHLEGLVTDTNKTGDIIFHFKYSREGLEQTWKEHVQNVNIRATLVRELYKNSEIYLTTCNISFDHLHLTVYPI